MNTRAAIYCRISQEDAGVPKVEIQERNAVAVAEDEGASEVVPRVWTTGGVQRSETAYVDNGIPATGRSITDGTRHKRPAFDQLVSDAEAGRFDMIVATSGDRLARNYPDGMALVAACVAGGVVIVTEDEGRVDPRTPGGEERAMGLFVGGRKEIRSRTAKQKRRYDSETSKGMPLWGRRTFGFAAREETNAHGRTSRRWVLHEPAEAEAIRWAVDNVLHNAEGSIYGVVREFTRRGLKPVSAGFRSKQGQDVPWTNQSIRELLVNPRLAGIVVRDGVIQDGVDAAWEPIISKELHAAVVAKLRDPNRRTSPGPKGTSLGSGIVRCSCGAVMRSTTANGVPALRCDVTRSTKAPDPMVRHQTIQTEKYVDPLIAREVARAFLFGPSDLLGEDRVDVGPLEVELGKLRSERERLARWVADDLMPEAEAVPQLRKLRMRETELSEQIEAAHAASVTSAMTARAARGVLHGPRVSFGDAHEALVTLEGRFKAMPLADRRELVRRLLDIQVMPGRGAGRVKITHKIVEHLNDEHRDEEELFA